MLRVTALSLSVVAFSSVFLAGCVNTGVPSAGDEEELTSAVAGKAVSIANQIGGSDGFGGSLMDGYMEHAEAHMGFNDQGDLADAAGEMLVRMENQSDQSCTFHLTYVASHMGLGEQAQDIEVPAGQETTVTVSCAEVMGLGSLDTPDSAACHLADGEPVSNMMSVPGFLGMDYECGGAYSFMLQPDIEDIDGDGDTSELVVIREAMQEHMQVGGPMGHMHGGQGMMN